MSFIKKNNLDFHIAADAIVLSKDYLLKNQTYFKKITGSRFSAIFGYNAFLSPVKVWTIMTNLYKDQMDPTLAIAGNVIEPKVRDYVIDQLKTNYVSYDPAKIGWDVFKDNPIFGGIPDGEPVDQNGKLAYTLNNPMLEIKTSSIDNLVFKNINGILTLQKDKNNLPLVKTIHGKYNSWFKDNNLKISIDYQMQLALYLYLRNTTKGLFAIAFMQTQDYAFPTDFDINNREIILADFGIDLTKMKFFVDYAAQWYQKHIVKGISPKLTDDDKLWLKNELKF